MKITCPHCGSVLTIRGSKPLSRIASELYCQCPNVTCAGTFVYILEIARTVSPSRAPNPEGEQLTAGGCAPAADTQS
ncbi:ogr/Delta-like zinc finger family protein [Ralstonia pseudosolanacearum]|nr:ogr/Delta-like zinc finger family protein [Ralstonia pseudosolanacearum]